MSSPRRTDLDQNPSGDRPSNWLEAARRSIHSQFESDEDCSGYIAERLSALLLERLPRDVGEELFKLLPEHERKGAEPLARSIGGDNASIGFTDFVERALHSIGCLRRLEPGVLDQIARRTAETYLWAVASEIPLELKQRLAKSLPLDLRSRMNLYTGHVESAKVA